MLKRSRVVSALPFLASAVGLFAFAKDASAQEITFGASGQAAVTDPTAQAAVDAQQEEWKERDRALNESSTVTGGVGLLHVQHAQAGVPGQFRVGFTSEYFSAGFLCTSSFPCSRPGGGSVVTSDSLDHIGGTLTLSATITKWLEGYIGTSAYANSDGANKPSLLQVLGDTDFGFKAYGKIGRWFHVGGAAELWLVNGTGAVGLDGSGTSGKLRGLATADLRGLEKKVPLRISLNGTYSIDNTGDVVTSTETARGTPITRIERFGLQVNRVDHFDIGVGVEGFVWDERFRPFLEYNILVPINRQGYQCHPKNPSGDNCLANDQMAPSRITVGARVLPWKHGFGLTAAFDVGVTGMNDFIEEMAPMAPWTFYLGAGWATDVWDRPEPAAKVVEKTVEAAPPLLGRVQGFVHETTGPNVAVPNAVISYDGHPDLTAMAAGGDGKFTTEPLPVGPYAFTVKADGFKDGKCSATLVQVEPPPPPAPPPAKPGEAAPPPPVVPPAQHPTVPNVTVDCALEPLPRLGKIIGHVKDAESNQPVAGAHVKLVDASHANLELLSDATGTFRFEAVAPGAAQMKVDADDYLEGVQAVDVKPRADNPTEVPLVHRPKNALVAVTAKEITIKQQIQFATDSAVILPASTALLTEIADVFNRNPRIHLVEIQGHTDSEGSDDHNQILSEDRAASVRNWLIAHGVDANRLSAKGYGEKKPLVPNVTAAYRAKNRRVQFIIVEQDAAAKPEPAKKK